MRKDPSPRFKPYYRGPYTFSENCKSQEDVMIERNVFVDLQDRLVAIEYKDTITSNFLPLLWQHTPRALLFGLRSKPEAIMVRQVQKFCHGWRFPVTTVPIPPEIYSSLDSMGEIPLSSLVHMVNQSQVSLSFEFDGIDDKLHMAPYRHEYGFDPNEAIYFQGDYEDCQWLKYLHFIKQHGIMPKDGQKWAMSFEEYVEHLKTPEEHLLELYGFFIG